MTHQPYSFGAGAFAFSYIEESDPLGRSGSFGVEDYGPRRPSERFTSIASDISERQSLCDTDSVLEGSRDSSPSRKRFAGRDFEMQQQRQTNKYLERFGECEEPKTGWERLEDGQIACHHKKLLFSTAVQCRNYLSKSGYIKSLAPLAQEEGAEFLANLDEECAEERSRLRTLQNSWTKQKNAINQEMKIHVAQLQKANRQLGHEKMVMERQLAKLVEQQKRELDAAKTMQQRKLESTAKLVQTCNGLPPFIAHLKHKPMSRHVVVVVALGPYGFTSDADGRDNSVQFAEFAAVNEADLLLLSLHTRIPGLKLQAAQLVKTQIEEHVFRSHGADHDWERICVLDETFTFPNGYFNVFDAVPEESVLVAQPRLGEAATGLKCKALPSMIVMPAQHTRLLEKGRKVFLRNMIAHKTKSRGYEAAEAFVWSLTTACAELGIPVCPVSECPVFSSKESSECPTEEESESGSEGPLASDEGSSSEPTQPAEM
jgi:hypothetical protein